MAAFNFSLLTKRRFAPYFVVQFLGAFNDNVLRFAMIFLASFTLFRDHPEKSAQLSTIAAGLFMLPYFCFSALAGQLADGMDKARLIRWIKSAEVIILALSLIGFWTHSIPALLTAFVYSLVVPACIIIRLGGLGWHWILNEPAFGVFMVVVFPFAFAVFSCIVNIDLLRSAVTSLSRLSIPVILCGAMLFLLVPGIRDDTNGPGRGRQPYMLKDPAKMREFAAFHDRIFQERNFDAQRQLYQRTIASIPLSPAMKAVFMISNFINVGFGVAVFCYILLLAVSPAQIEEKTCNHLVFVLAAMAIWFPCRAYAEWYMNLSDTSWIHTYQAAWILAVLLVVACVVLALKMANGSLYHRFVIPAGAVSVVLGAIAALKPKLLTQAALDVSTFNSTFMFAFVLILAALLFYVSSSIHQQR